MLNHKRIFVQSSLASVKITRSQRNKNIPLSSTKSCIPIYPRPKRVCAAWLTRPSSSSVQVSRRLLGLSVMRPFTSSIIHAFRKPYKLNYEKLSQIRMHFRASDWKSYRTYVLVSKKEFVFRTECPLVSRVSQILLQHTRCGLFQPPPQYP